MALEKKYAKHDNVKSDIFFVVPSNTLERLNQFVYNLADYNVFVISAFLPLLFTSSVYDVIEVNCLLQNSSIVNPLVVKSALRLIPARSNNLIVFGLTLNLNFLVYSVSLVCYWQPLSGNAL